MKTKLSSLLWATGNLIRATPDFRYKPVYEGAVCEYNGGGDSKYPDQIGCIIGQAFRACGEQLNGSQNYTTVGVLYSDTESPIVGFLGSIQTLQDSGKSWGEAWEIALAASSEETLRIVNRHVPFKIEK